VRQGAKRILVVLILSSCGVAAIGCGGSGDDPEAVVKDFLSAIAEGDGDKACDQLTGDARREFLAGVGKENCDDAAELVSGALSDDEKDKLKDAKLSSKSSDDGGDTLDPGDDADAIVHVEGGEDVPLEKVDGDYKIAGFSF
jgi:hypothetical protein